MFIWEWNDSSSETNISLKFEMLWVKTFQIAKVNTGKTSVTRVEQKTIHCLIFAFRTTNAVLDPDRAQSSWRPWPQERLLFKPSTITKQHGYQCGCCRTCWRVQGAFSPVSVLKCCLLGRLIDRLAVDYLCVQQERTQNNFPLEIADILRSAHYYLRSVPNEREKLECFI